MPEITPIEIDLKVSTFAPCLLLSNEAKANKMELKKHTIAVILSGRGDASTILDYLNVI